MIDPRPMSPDAPPDSAARLPVRDLALEGYRAVFRNLRGFVARAWPWWIIVLAAGLGTQVFAGSETGRTVGAFVTFPVWAVAGATFLVRWHRHVLLGEAATTRAALRFGRRELRFLVTTVLFYLVLAAPMVATGLFVGALGPIVAGSGLDRILAFGPVAAFAVLLTVAPRLWLALPMVALDTPDHPLAAAWRLGRGQTWRLLGGALLTLGPLGIVARVIEKGIEVLPESPETAVLALVLSLASVVVFFAEVAVGAGFISHAYARLTDHPLPAGSRPS